LEEFYKATAMLNLHDKNDPDTKRNLALSILDLTLPNNLAFINKYIKIGLTQFPDFVLITKNEKQLFRWKSNDEMIEEGIKPKSTNAQRLYVQMDAWTSGRFNNVNCDIIENLI
jgi:hypothetical protein